MISVVVGSAVVVVKDNTVVSGAGVGVSGMAVEVEVVEVVVGLGVVVVVVVVVVVGMVVVTTGRVSKLKRSGSPNRSPPHSPTLRVSMGLTFTIRLSLMTGTLAFTMSSAHPSPVFMLKQ